MLKFIKKYKNLSINKKNQKLITTEKIQTDILARNNSLQFALVDNILHFEKNIILCS